MVIQNLKWLNNLRREVIFFLFCFVAAVQSFTSTVLPLFLEIHLLNEAYNERDEWLGVWSNS